MKELVEKIVATCDALKEDLGKDTKAAAARARKATLELEKLGKEFRKASVAEQKK